MTSPSTKKLLPPSEASLRAAREIAETLSKRGALLLPTGWTSVFWERVIADIIDAESRRTPEFDAGLEEAAKIAREKAIDYGTKAGEQTTPDLRSAWDCWSRGANAVEKAIRARIAAAVEKAKIDHSISTEGSTHRRS